MNKLSEALIAVALIAGAVALIITNNGDWVFGLVLLGMFILLG